MTTDNTAPRRQQRRQPLTQAAPRLPLLPRLPRFLWLSWLLWLIAFAAAAAPPEDESPEDEGMEAAGETPADEAPAPLPGQAEAREPLPLESLRTFGEVFTRIKQDYVDEVSDRELLEHAIRGMLSGLDPHSAYLDEESFQAVQEGSSGQFGGLGIEIVMEDGFIKVIAPIDNTPAARAGVQSGDLIIRLDGKPVKGMNLEDAVSILRGPPGTDVVITLLRGRQEQPIELTVTRAIITSDSVSGRFLEPGYAYVRISNFQEQTAEDLRETLRQLDGKDQDGISGLILDLRNNPGGILSAAVGVSDLFLDEGLIVYTEGRLPDSQLDFHAKATDSLDAAPMVVLVNGGSASGSEIVAGALQDHRRALIMGERTFGKGSVQTVLEMNSRAALKLTTARYFTPFGRSIQVSGIEPDIEVAPRQFVEQQQWQPKRVKEGDLHGHLENTQQQEAGEGADPSRSAHREDYQLLEALNAIKAMILHGDKLQAVEAAPARRG